MFRASCLFAVHALVLGTLSAGEFPLEDYVPADFHRHYLSIRPSLSLRDDEGKDEYPPYSYDRMSDSYSSEVMLNQGSQRFGQALLWNVSNGFGIHKYGSGDGNEFDPTIPPAQYSVGSSRNGQQSYGYSGFTRLSGQWYPKGDFFLSPSAESNLRQTPRTSGSYQFANLALAGQNLDSTRFTYSHGKNSGKDIFIGLDARLAFGYGRIQDVTFAETGLFLLDRLSEAEGREIRLDRQDMHALEAHLESRRKLRPFYDGRRASIYDMESVVEFLEKKTSVTSVSTRAVLEMADEWNHAGRHRRMSGWELRAYPFLRSSWNDQQSSSDAQTYEWDMAGAGPFNLDSLKQASAVNPSAYATQESMRRFSSESSLGAGIAVGYQRPWSRFYQFGLTAQVRMSREEKEYGQDRAYAAGPGNTVNGARKLTLAYPFAEASWSASAAVYPNSRTTVRLVTGGDASKKLDYLGSKQSLTDALGSTPTQKAIGYAQSAGLEVGYFLNPRLSLTWYVNGRIDWRTSRDEILAPIWDYGVELGRQATWNRELGLFGGLTYYLF